MLVETHSWKDYANRVKTHHDTVLASLQIAQLQSSIWKEIEKKADQVILKGSAELEFQHTKKSQKIEFPGYAFTKN